MISVLAFALPALGASLLFPRGSIDSDKVVGFDQSVPSGTLGEVYLAYQPKLYVVNGCVPFPAVDVNGNIKYDPNHPRSDGSS